MSNAVLRDHVYAIIKNAKKMEKVLAQQVDSEQSQRKDKKLSQAVPVIIKFRFCHMLYFVDSYEELKQLC